jgi:hypothetical protein
MTADKTLTKEELINRWLGRKVKYYTEFTLNQDARAFCDKLDLQTMRDEFLSDLNTLLREERLKVIDEVLAMYVRDGNPEVWRDQITKFKSQQQ